MMEEIPVDQVDMQDLYGDPEYREYWHTLHGSYIGALMPRVPKIKGSGAKRPAARHYPSPEPEETRDSAAAAAKPIETQSSSTLSDAVREAFRETQREIEWKGPASIMGSSALGGGKETDFGEASEKPSSSSSVQVIAPQEPSKESKPGSAPDDAFGEPDYEHDFATPL